MTHPFIAASQGYMKAQAKFLFEAEALVGRGYHGWGAVEKASEELKLAREEYQKEKIKGMADVPEAADKDLPVEPKLKVAVLSESEAVSLNEGGFFTLILDHPGARLYLSDGALCVWIPGRGMVQIAETTDRE